MADNPLTDQRFELQQLLQVWIAYQAQTAWHVALQRGENVAAATELLIGLPEVTVLEALEANRRLVNMLMQQRRDTVAAARDTGSSWAVIAAALGTSKQRAHARYHAVKPWLPTHRSDPR